LLKGSFEIITTPCLTKFSVRFLGDVTYMPMADAGAQGVTTAERSAARVWTDQQLLNGYTRGSERDFADLVARHAGWVYAAARRRVHDPALAEDVTQAVFVVLARKARSLRDRATLEPWLFKVLKYTASVALRSARNRRHHEREAAAVHERQQRSAEAAAVTGRDTFGDNDDGEGTWSGLEVVLDDVVGQLSSKDLEAVLLRFYQRKTYADVGRAIQTTEDGARKRVDRADPVAKLAAAAYLCGRAQGREEAGVDVGPLLSDGPDAVKKIRTEPGVREQLDEIRSVSEDVVAEVADVLCYAVGKADAVDLLSQWEGFGRFSRSRLGLEPSAAVAAFGLPNVDVQKEMKTVCGAQANEDDAAYWAEQWCRGWDRRFT
jgi:RNA polymerase sigma factor (sigma-70 family)